MKSAEQLLDDLMDLESMSSRLDTIQEFADEYFKAGQESKEKELEPLITNLQLRVTQSSINDL